MKTTTRWPRSLAAAGLVGALVALPAAAVAQTAAEAGDYGGEGTSSLVEVGVAQSVEIPGGVLLDAILAPTTNAADTTDGLSFEGEDGLTAYGKGTNVESALAGEDLISDVLVNAVQTAPPDNEEPEVDEIGSAPDNPLIQGTLFHAEALARDPATVACPDDGLVSRGFSLVTEGEVLPGQIDEDTAVVTVGQTVSSESRLDLVDVEGQSTRGVQEQAIADLTSLNLFGEIDVEIVSPPTLTATATGTSGSASVTYSNPVVRINGEELVDEIEIEIGQDGTANLPTDLDPLEQALDPALTELSPLFAELGLTAFRIEKLGVTSENVAGDGTGASAEATLLQVTLLGADQGTLATIDIAPMSAAAQAPVGGVVCDVADVASDVQEDEEEPEALAAAQDTSMPRTGGGLALVGMLVLAAGALLVRRR